MKIIYFSHPCFTDCDFPLVGELQRRGHDVSYYIPIALFNKRSALLDIKRLHPKTGIFRAVDIYEEFRAYENVIDLSKVYVVNKRHKQKYHPANLWLMLRLVWHFHRQQADVIQLTKEPSLMMKCLYLMKKKLVLTVHDPFIHSGAGSKGKERDRKTAYRNIQKLVLLNGRQVKDFSEHYHIPESRIFLSKLGEYGCIEQVPSVPAGVGKPYILFFGLIAEYKGIEYLLEAMVRVHRQYPEVMLVVAGGGKYYFDISPFQGLNYIQFRNRYISIAELSGLLRDCEFGVCPYKDATQSGVVQTAFTLGVPMVVTDVGALADAVRDGKTGIVVKPCDADALAVGICRLLEDDRLLESMRNNIDSEWKPNMGWRSIAEDYIKCYQSKIE